MKEKSLEIPKNDLFGDIATKNVVTPNPMLDVETFGKIVLSSTVNKDEYTNYIQEHFDLAVQDTCKVLIPKLNLSKLPSKWNIGVICGASGSGKSTILHDLRRELCGDGKIPLPTFDNTKTLISNFDNMTPEQATLLLSQMGLSCVPTWIRPYRVLSNGEQYRASLAKLVAENKDDEIIFVDEYTSVVDRNVAMAMSNALQKYIRRAGKKVILATCHYDVFDWLRPDWIFDLNKGGALSEGDYLRRPRPQIELQVYRTTCDTWERFKKYHYMTSALNEAAMCFVFTWNNKAVAFYSVLPQPSGMYKNAYRGHRLVVLPDFQGLGIGSKVSEFIGGVLKSIGKTMYTKTVNPAIGLYRSRATDKWQPSAANLKADKQEHIDKCSSMGGLTRPSYCFKYIGEPIYGFENLVMPIDDVRKANARVGQLTLDF